MGDAVELQLKLSLTERELEVRPPFLCPNHVLRLVLQYCVCASALAVGGAVSVGVPTPLLPPVIQLSHFFVSLRFRPVQRRFPPPSSSRIHAVFMRSRCLWGVFNLCSLHGMMRLDCACELCREWLRPA